MYTADEEIIYRQGGTPVTSAVLDQTNHSVHWKECATCTRIKPFGQFRRDSSYREGYRDQCLECESAPRLSTEEHIHCLRERNYAAATPQRWGKDQADFLNEAARKTGWMHHSDFIRKLDGIKKHQLYICDGRIVGDLAIYKVWDRIVRRNGRCYSAAFDPERPTFAYICYMPKGWSPEYSVINFNDLDVPVNEKLRGWRTVLLRLIKSGVVTPEGANKAFGEARGVASVPFLRELYRFRNRK